MVVRLKTVEVLELVGVPVIVRVVGYGSIEESMGFKIKVCQHKSCWETDS